MTRLGLSSLFLAALREHLRDLDVDPDADELAESVAALASTRPHGDAPARIAAILGWLDPSLRCDEESTHTGAAAYGREYDRRLFAIREALSDADVVAAAAAVDAEGFAEDEAPAPVMPRLAPVVRATRRSA